jgi:hypothetical protein
MIEPPSRNRGSAFWTENNSPRTLMPQIVSKRSAVIDPIGAGQPTPALANRTSVFPFCCFRVA